MALSYQRGTVSLETNKEGLPSSLRRLRACITERDLHYYQHGRHVGTPTKAASEKVQERGHVHSTRCVHVRGYRGYSRMRTRTAPTMATPLWASGVLKLTRSIAFRHFNFDRFPHAIQRPAPKPSRGPRLGGEDTEEFLAEGFGAARG